MPPVTADRPQLREETPCAVCGRREYEVIALRDRNGKPLRTVLCAACGLVWTNPRPSSEDVDRYYASTYRRDYARQAVPTTRKILRGLLGAEERRRALAPLWLPGKRILDVGCGAGEFVFLLRRHGLEASGIEPGSEFAEFSRRTLKIPVETVTVESASIEPASLDVITMFHMLEHVADPSATLRTIRGWLEPAHGRLIVEVPNVESTVQAPQHRFHYAHLYSFSAATLAALGRSVALSVLQTLESDDGGNITCVFGWDAGKRGPLETDPHQASRTRQILRDHTRLRHYLQPTPYRRALGRLARRWREDRLLRRFPSVEAVLQWASSAQSLPVPPSLDYTKRLHRPG
jgi:2-polyprenyl-3-methyl-5-hydroxy-6-metoxy-1,4-benzoquinol methylase